MTPIPKDAPFRDKKYRQWIASLPCVACGAPADHAHHVISCGFGGGMGTKPGDQHCIPLCAGHHHALHHDVILFESIHGRQLDHLNRIVELARQGKKLDPFLCFTTGL